MLFPKEFFEKVNFEKNQQKAKKYAKLQSVSLLEGVRLLDQIRYILTF